MRIDYVEFPSRDFAATKAFYGAAFGWTFEEWGPDYMAFADAGIAIPERNHECRCRFSDLNSGAMRVWCDTHPEPAWEYFG